MNRAPLPRTEWAHRIPHAGRMCLLDAVRAFDAIAIHACSDSHRDPENPLRRDGRLHAVHLFEYGAQAGAVHAALTAAEPGAGGMLVRVREVRLAVEFVDDLPGTLEVHAERLYADAAGAQYAFRVLHRECALATGRVAVLHRVA